MSRVLSEQEIVRRESLQKLIDLGINPYPSESLDVNTTSKQIKSKYKEGDLMEVVIAGRIMSRRIMGKASFAELQDNVAPFSGEIARKIIEDAYHCRINDVFLEFDEVPLASASVAQVHSAKLKDGRDFIIKVIRPGIDVIIKKDLDLLKLLARKAEKYNKNAKSLKFTGVIEEFERTIFNELDLQREASNASQLYRNFENEDCYYVPKINWELTKRNVLAIERIDGIPIRDIEALNAANIDLKCLAEFGVKIFFTQVFRDNFFHADMHPGNIFVAPGNSKESPIIKVIDFVIICSLKEYDQYYLANNLMAF